ncbi:hypothetical protein OPT61_g7273 [Boeremia exigua]|uniref:Uncharacterized protein n=1 Tax=Boeremia exigua TaxID=749465 RepID=A0ACC2I2W1_9PLEO|nr:hypothetical protein OPT61_g7273 [Boeremia exigua]
MLTALPATVSTISCLGQQGSVQLCEHVQITWAEIRAHIIGWQQQQHGHEDWQSCLDSFSIECHSASHDTRCTDSEITTWPTARLGISTLNSDLVVLNLEWKPHIRMDTLSQGQGDHILVSELRQSFQRLRSVGPIHLLCPTSHPSVLPEITFFGPSSRMGHFVGHAMGNNNFISSLRDSVISSTGSWLSYHNRHGIGRNGRKLDVKSHLPRDARDTTVSSQCLIVTYEKDIMICKKRAMTDLGIKLVPTDHWLHAMDTRTYPHPQASQIRPHAVDCSLHPWHAASDPQLDKSYDQSHQYLSRSPSSKFFFVSAGELSYAARQPLASWDCWPWVLSMSSEGQYSSRKKQSSTMKSTHNRVPVPLNPGAEYGNLPFDQFVMAHWDNTQPEERDQEQWDVLAGRWLSMSHIDRSTYWEVCNSENSPPQNASYLPTQSQIQRILAPHQTTTERNLSQKFLSRIPCPVWIRTCYAVELEAAYREMFETGQTDFGPEFILDDEILYSPCDQDCTRVFLRLPHLPDTIPYYKDGYPENDDAPLDISPPDDEAMVPLFNAVMKSKSIHYLLDLEALQEKLVKVQYFDIHGQMVWYNKIRPEHIGIFEVHPSGGHLSGHLETCKDNRSLLEPGTLLDLEE